MYRNNPNVLAIYVYQAFRGPKFKLEAAFPEEPYDQFQLIKSKATAEPRKYGWMISSWVNESKSVESDKFYFKARKHPWIAQGYQRHKPHVGVDLDGVSERNV